MAEWNELPLTAEHAFHLQQQALTPDVVERHGIRSVTRTVDLPGEFRHFGEAAVPAILFPWTEPDGTTVNQLRVPDGYRLPTGEAAKYLWARGRAAQLGELRRNEDASTALIVEGTKQGLAAAAWAPEDYAVYAIAGCRMWSHEGTSTRFLSMFDGKDVVVLLDADAASNIDVYDAGMALKEALDTEDANSVKFGRVPGGKKSGLDDYLGSRDPERRTKLLKNLVDRAKSKPADAKPKPKPKKVEPPEDHSTAAKDQPLGDDGRRIVTDYDDTLYFVDTVINILDEYWNADRLFCYANKLAERTSQGMALLDKDSVRWPIFEAMKPLAPNQKGEIKERKFSSDETGMVLARSTRFAELEKLSSTPFVRPDGSICQSHGYDGPSKSFLELAPEFENLDVPDDPDEEHVSAALKLINDELLPDFPFATQSDRANTIALLLTPFVRGMISIVPLAVVDGLQPGVGKNLLADVVSIIVLGHDAETLSFPRDNEEMRKQITSNLRAGAELMVYDEARFITGEALTQALTASTWRDRTLGKSESVSYPNRTTWISLGNNVQLGGDMGRRVYRINLAYDGENPEMRDPASFRHQNLRKWVHENRADLVQACLTLIRYWFSQGRPKVDTPRLGSFETWVETMAGILGTAGVPGFMDNVAEWRSESDFEKQLWIAHLHWLHETFTVPFTTAQSKSAMVQGGVATDAPPGLSDPSASNYTQQLGKAYGKMQGRVMGGLRLVKHGTGHGTKTLWRIETFGGGGEDDEPPQEPLFDAPEPEPDPTPEPEPEEKPVLHKDQLDIFDILLEPEEEEDPAANLEFFGDLVIDIETLDADAMFHHRDPDDPFVRLCGYYGDEPLTTPSAEELVARISRADRVLGHNLVGFDLPALAHHAGLDYEAAAAKAVDSLIVARQVDPPSAKGMPRGYYSLDSLADRLKVARKTDDLKDLAKRYGGFGEIPHEILKPYLIGDLVSSSEVGQWALEHYDNDPYIRREHRVMARLNRSRLEGFRVDVPELEKRLAEQVVRREKNFERLATEYNVPMADDKGKPYKSPLATLPGKQALVDALAAAGAPYYPKTEKSGDISTNKDNLNDLVKVYSDPQRMAKLGLDPDLDRIKDLVELVQSVTGERTVYGTIRDHMVGDRIHPQTSPEQASGRWSVTKPGLTVLGKRDGKYTEREVLLPEEGHVIIAVDLDQVDARGVAGHSQDPAYMALFEPGRDLHSEVAMKVFGRCDGVWRDRAKIGSHGWSYGLGINGLVGQLGIPYDVAEQFYLGMRDEFPVLLEWQANVRQQAEDGLLLDNGFGRKMRADPERAYTQAPGLVGQGTTRDILAEWILNLPEEVVPMIRAVVHDEIVFSIPEADLEDVQRSILAATNFEFRGVPITAGCSDPGKNWGVVYAK